MSRVADPPEPTGATSAAPASSLVAGVDGYRDGWVVAHLPLAAGVVRNPDEEGPITTVRFSVASDFAAVLAATRDCGAVGVDMPLALPERGVRESDAAVKAYLGGGGRSLFWTPTRAAIAADTHAEAVRRNQARGGKGPSAQGWGLVAKIREVRAALLPEPDRRVFEAHPESSFTAMNKGRSLPSKRTGVGVGRRLQLLEGWCGGVVVGLATLPPGPLVDDALDAVAAAWTAARVLAGHAMWFGPTEPDDEGLIPAVAV